jgi:hypothetical protein
MRNHSTIASWRPIEEQLPPARTIGRPAGFVSDVVVPLAESAITGLLVAALVTALVQMLWPGHADNMLFAVAWLVATTGA